MAGERVLVVEDNEKNMKLFRDVLQATGYSTLEATTGEEAVELAVSHAAGTRPDGRPAARHRRRRGARATAAETSERPPSRCSALTAQAMSGDRERFLEAGFDGYLAKPVDVAELHRGRPGALRSWLTRPARILVVDDVPENVRLLEAVLVPHGYEVVTASDGVRGARARRGGRSPT